MRLKSEILSQTDRRRIKFLDSLNWEFEDASTRYATHNYHPYSAKYIPQIPYYLMSTLSRKNDLILDNFMGSGTTLVESRILGRNAIGIDINPLACLISKVKTTAIQKSELEKIIDISRSMKESVLKLRQLNSISLNHRTESDIDNHLAGKIPHPNILKWFDQSAICELLLIKLRIDLIENDNMRDFLLVAFSSILRGVSNTSSDFGNLMINKHAPKKHKIYEKFNHRVDIMVAHMQEFSQMIKNNSNIRIVNHDTRRLEFMGEGTVDFICTHPPYMASVPYAEYQKLSLWWLGFKPKELENKLIGGRRSRTDTPQRFFHDMHLTLIEMKRVLCKKKYCCIIIGNPVYNRKAWELNEIIKKDAIGSGFTLLREISRRKYRLTMGKMKQEFILIFKN